MMTTMQTGPRTIHLTDIPAGEIECAVNIAGLQDVNGRAIPKGPHVQMVLSDLINWEAHSRPFVLSYSIAGRVGILPGRQGKFDDGTLAETDLFVATSSPNSGRPPQWQWVIEPYTDQPGSSIARAANNLLAGKPTIESPSLITDDECFDGRSAVTLPDSLLGGIDMRPVRVSED